MSAETARAAPTTSIPCTPTATSGWEHRDLPTGTLATTCTWYFPLFSEVMESDVKFNGVDHSWTIGVALCVGTFDVEAVMTHERGHTFGLGHVSESASPTMTMSPQIGECSDRERTLGYGDMLGLIYK